MVPTEEQRQTAGAARRDDRVGCHWNWMVITTSFLMCSRRLDTGNFQSSSSLDCIDSYRGIFQSVIEFRLDSRYGIFQLDTHYGTFQLAVKFRIIH